MVENPLLGSFSLREWKLAHEPVPEGDEPREGEPPPTVDQIWAAFDQYDIEDVQTLSDMVCDQVHRTLTQDEWEQYIGQDVEYRPTCPNLPPG